MGLPIRPLWNWISRCHWLGGWAMVHGVVGTTGAAVRYSDLVSKVSEMDLPANRGRWRRRSARSHLPLVVAVLVLLLPAYLLFSSAYSTTLRALFAFPFAPGGGEAPRCGGSVELEGQRFLWYAPHSGFSNQVGELRNAAVAAALLNRTLVVPPVLDHHAVVLGSCPKFRVTDPSSLRAAVWDHTMQLLLDRR
jgi:hypothetical protein